MFIVELGGPVGLDLHVFVSTSDGTARAGVDYDPLAGLEVVIPANDIFSQPFPIVSVIPDLFNEPTETFYVNITSIFPNDPDFVTIGRGQAEGRILNDDAGGPPEPPPPAPVPEPASLALACVAAAVLARMTRRRVS